MSKRSKREFSPEIQALIEKCRADAIRCAEYFEEMDRLEKEIDEDFARIEASLAEIQREMEEMRKGGE